MNYEKIYFNIIEKYQKFQFKDDYYEIHHILPKCLGGSDEHSNLVKLPAKAHFVCHHLLCKIYPKNYKIICAFNYMCSLSKTHIGRYANSRIFSVAKALFKDNNPMKHLDVVEKMLSTRRQNENKNKNYIRRIGSSERKLFIIKKFEKGLKKWKKFHDERKNLNINGFPLCKWCGKLMVKYVGNRKSVLCGYSCANYYRLRGPHEHSDMDIQSLLNNAQVEYDKYSIEELYEMMHLKDKNQNIKKGQRFCQMSEEEFEIFLTNKSKSTKNSYRRMRKEAIIINNS